MHPFKTVKRLFFVALARVNRVLLPSLWRKDLQRLNKAEKLIAGWRYYVTRNALGD